LDPLGEIRRKTLRRGQVQRREKTWTLDENNSMLAIGNHFMSSEEGKTTEKRRGTWFLTGSKYPEIDEIE